MSEQPPSNPYGTPGEQPPPQGPQQQWGPPPSYGQPYGAVPHYGGPAPDKRPGTVTTASVITIVSSALTALLCLLAGIGFAAASSDDGFRRDFERQLEETEGLEGVSTDDLTAVGLVVVAALLIWCVIAIVTAILAMRRHNWARIVTVISAGVSAVLGLLALPITLLTLVAAIAAIVCYFVGGANEWYARSSSPTNPQAPPPAQPWR